MQQPQYIKAIDLEPEQRIDFMSSDTTQPRNPDVPMSDTVIGLYKNTRGQAVIRLVSSIIVTSPVAQFRLSEEQPERQYALADRPKALAVRGVTIE